ncbi:hypothetical protein VTN00DRAFT_5 [Thermoascus crustaceus]|uniref:uncharacterized protein n=1 Tax=Thermoascus crustaceus TaxID=5088 RepID=UPI00374442F1
MSGFGFSVGDFVTGIKLAKDLVQALSNGTGAQPAYRRLIAELNNLVRVLNDIRSVQLTSDSDNSQTAVLEEAVSQCQRTIEAFLQRNAKFQSSLGDKRTASRLRANLHKIQWAVGRKDEVDQLRVEILGHTTTINTILIARQSSAAAMQRELLQDCRRDTREQSAILYKTQKQTEQTQEMMRAQADTIFKISQILSSAVSQPKPQDLQSIITDVLDTNMKIWESLLDIQRSQALQSHVPPRVELQQPVHFEDAHGRVTPFHTEFINSFDAFQAVMEIRFRHMPGLKKLQKMEYLIREIGSNRWLDLRAPWESVFLPGRKVAMSMVFWRPATSMRSCPACHFENESRVTSEIQCPNSNCRIRYEHVLELDTSRNVLEYPRPSVLIRTPLQSNCLIIGPDGNCNEGEDEIHHFRRVQVRHILQCRKKSSSILSAGSIMPHKLQEYSLGEKPFYGLRMRTGVFDTVKIN